MKKNDMTVGAGYVKGMAGVIPVMVQKVKFKKKHFFRNFQSIFLSVRLGLSCPNRRAKKRTSSRRDTPLIDHNFFIVVVVNVSGHWSSTQTMVASTSAT